MADPSPQTGVPQWAREDGLEEAPSTSRGLARSVVLTSLAPFFILSLGHYFSVNTLMLRSGVQRMVWHNQRGLSLGVFEDVRADVDVFVWTEMAMAAVSFAMLCLSWAATLLVSSTVNSCRRLTPGELFSKVIQAWREPSITRMYATILLLGYTLSLILVVAVVLLITSADGINPRVLRSLLCLLALLLLVYLGVVGSVGTGTFLVVEAQLGVEALRRVPVLMEARMLQGFLLFFLSLVVTHGYLVSGGLWMDDLRWVKVAAFWLSPGPVLTNAIWMVGACGLFGYVGVLLQV